MPRNRSRTTSPVPPVPAIAQDMLAAILRPPRRPAGTKAALKAKQKQAATKKRAGTTKRTAAKKRTAAPKPKRAGK